MALFYQKIILEEYRYLGTWQKNCFVQFVEFADLTEAVCVLSGQQLIRFQVSGSVFVIFPVMAAFGFRDQIIPGE